MVIWSEPAKADLRSIHDFIAHDSDYYAKKVTQDIASRTDILTELPRMGRMVPEFGDENEHPGVIALLLSHPLRDYRPGCLRAGCDP